MQTHLAVFKEYIFPSVILWYKVLNVPMNKPMNKKIVQIGEETYPPYKDKAVKYVAKTANEVCIFCSPSNMCSICASHLKLIQVRLMVVVCFLFVCLFYFLTLACL